MSKLDEIISDNPDMTFLSADGFEDCVVGFEPNTEVLVYSIQKCIQHLVDCDGMDYEEAEEYFFYNVSGSYVGEKTPIFIYT